MNFAADVKFLNNSQALNLRHENVTSLPTVVAAEQGRCVYYNSKPYYNNGTAWVTYPDSTTVPVPSYTLFVDWSFSNSAPYFGSVVAAIEYARVNYASQHVLIEVYTVPSETVLLTSSHTFGSLTINYNKNGSAGTFSTGSSSNYFSGKLKLTGKATFTTLTLYSANTYTGIPTIEVDIDIVNTVYTEVVSGDIKIKHIIGTLYFGGANVAPTRLNFYSDYIGTCKIIRGSAIGTYTDRCYMEVSTINTLETTPATAGYFDLRICEVLTSGNLLGELAGVATINIADTLWRGKLTVYPTNASGSILRFHNNRFEYYNATDGVVKIVLNTFDATTDITFENCVIRQLCQGAPAIYIDNQGYTNTGTMLKLARTRIYNMNNSGFSVINATPNQQTPTLTLTISCSDSISNTVMSGCTVGTSKHTVNAAFI